MAKIWPVYEGSEPTRGGPWADIPVEDAISLFELRPEDFVSDLSATPRFGKGDRDLSYLGYRHVVAEIGPGEGRRAKFKPGFYRSRIKPDDAVAKLIQQAFVAELGQKNVVRVEQVPSIDSLGQGALKITVVIAPGAMRKFAKGASLDALVRLHERLSEMGEHRTPIVGYATEAELAHDGGH